MIPAVAHWLNEHIVMRFSDPMLPSPPSSSPVSAENATLLKMLPVSAVEPVLSQPSQKAQLDPPAAEVNDRCSNDEREQPLVRKHWLPEVTFWIAETSLPAPVMTALSMLRTVSGAVVL